MTKFCIDMACSDAIGNPLGYTDSIRVRRLEEFDDLLQMVGSRLSLRLLDPNRIKIGHIWLPTHGYQPWFGNRGWCEVSTDADNVVRLLAYLQRRGWQCEMGVCELFEKFNGKQSIAVEDLTKGAL